MTNKWTNTASLPQPLDHTAAAVSGGELYVVGGRSLNRDDLSNKLFVYNPPTNKWIEDANLPTAHCVLIANSYMKFYMQYKELTTPEHPAPTGLMILRLIHGYQYNQCQ
jgi:hypothetical protein